MDEKKTFYSYMISELLDFFFDYTPSFSPDFEVLMSLTKSPKKIVKNLALGYC